jgi:hypothetical protein
LELLKRVFEGNGMNGASKGKMTRQKNILGSLRKLFLNYPISEGIYRVFVVISRGVWAKIGLVKVCVFLRGTERQEWQTFCIRQMVYACPLIVLRKNLTDFHAGTRRELPIAGTAALKAI